MEGGAAIVRENTKELLGLLEREPSTLSRRSSGSAPALFRHISGGLVRETSFAANVEDDEGAKLPYETIIHFTNSDAVVNLASPWKVLEPKTCTGTGFHIGDRRILTNCHVVQGTTSLRVFRHGRSGNFSAKVLCESAVCDLAIVTVEDESFWVDLPAVTFQEKVPELDAEVCAVGYPLGAKSVTNTRGVVANVKMSDLSLTVCELQEKQLTVQIDAAINPGNSGGPVFNKKTGEVVGVAFSGRDKAEGMGFIIPTPVVRNFLETYEQTKSFGRLPSLGIITQKLENSVLRSLLFNGGEGPPEHHDGVLILKVLPRSCAAEAGVHAGDILMAIDGAAISEDGEVDFRGHERLGYDYLITKKRLGHQVKLSLLRNPAVAISETPGAAFDINQVAEAPARPEPLQLVVTLAPTHELLPRELNKDYHASYVMVGGLVFVVAGLPLLMYALEKELNTLFRGLYQMYPSLATNGGGSDAAAPAARWASEPEPEEALMCSGLLSHDVNVGFGALVGLRLRKIDGVAVRSMAHAVELLAPALAGSEKPLRSHLVLQFFGSSQAAVLGVEALREAMPTIQEQHQIAKWTNVALPA